MSKSLAGVAEKTRPLALPDRFDRTRAHLAGQARAAVDHRLQLEMPRIPIRIGKVTQGAAATLHGAGQHLPDGGMQPGRARPAQGAGVTMKNINGVQISLNMIYGQLDIYF